MPDDAEPMPEPPEIPADLRGLLVGVKELEKAAHLASSYFDSLVARGFAQNAALHLVTGWQEVFFTELYRQNVATYPTPRPEEEPDEHPT